MRDDKLQAQHCRVPQPERDREFGPSPFDQKQYWYSFGGPIPGAIPNKLFLLRRAEWVNFFQVATNTRPFRPRHARGDFNELLGPTRSTLAGDDLRDPTRASRSLAHYSDRPPVLETASGS